MTICIAAICEVNDAQAILVCADRLVSATVQFDSGESKISRISNNCIIMESSSNTLTSKGVVERVTSMVSGRQMTVKEIADVFANECVNHKKEILEKNVLFRYNLASDALKTDLKNLLREIMADLENYHYPTFDFIVCGIDASNHGHIYKVNQDGNITPWDFLGFAATGSGSTLAFAELTKWQYSERIPFTQAIPRIYFAKKVSERAQGVGMTTDFAMLEFRTGEEGSPSEPKFYPISNNAKFIADLDNAFQSIREFESETITKMHDMIARAVIKDDN